MSDPSPENYHITDCTPDHIIVLDRGAPGSPGSVGPPGPQGPPGVDGVDGENASTEEVAATFAAWEASHPQSIEWSSPGPVDEVTLNHALGFKPNVTVTDSSGRELMVAPVITSGQVYIDLGSLMSVTVLLS